MSRGPFYVARDLDWPEAYFAVFARDENDNEVEFAGKFLWEEDAKLCAEAMNERGLPPEFPAMEN